MNDVSKAVVTRLSLILGLLFGLSCLANAGTGIVEVELKKPNLYIFSVGVDKYQLPLSNLNAAVNDATALAEEFERRGKGNFGEVKKIVLFDAAAKKADIVREFERLARDISSNDVFIFNFSGMGYSYLSAKDTQFYLFPSGFTQETFETTGISNSQLQAFFRKIRAQSKLVILDSCKSADGYESAVNSFIEQDKKIADLNDENVLFIGTDTFSMERDGHGSITQIILDGLKESADFNRDGIVSSRELEAQIYKGGVEYAARYYPEFHPRTVTRGVNFNIGFTDRELAKIAEIDKAKTSSSGSTEKTVSTVSNDKRDAQAEAKPSTKTGENETRSNETRADILNLDGETEETAAERKGTDYALLFANDVFDNPAWRKLKNPQNDVNDVAKELRERYGFKEIIIKTNLTAQEIYDTIEAYQQPDFKNFKQGEDQLFIFFAGHGIADKYNKGFYVGRDSPYPLARTNENQFVSLDGVLNAIDRIPIEHIMVIFDACYAGKMWEPSIQFIQENAALPTEKYDSTIADFEMPSFIRNVGASVNLLNLAANSLIDEPKISKLAYAKRKMKQRTRRVVTSGDKPVFDSWKKKDGTSSNNSPFADAFLQALRTDGGKNEILITAEIIPHIDELKPEPQVGKLSRSTGDFVFVKLDQAKENKE